MGMMIVEWSRIEYGIRKHRLNALVGKRESIPIGPIKGFPDPYKNLQKYYSRFLGRRVKSSTGVLPGNATLSARNLASMPSIRLPMDIILN